MIIVSVGCGLGNQMFEYAYIVKLKKLYPQQKIKMDISNSFPKAHNGYELNKVFGINIEECTEKEFKEFANFEIKGKNKFEREICRLYIAIKQRMNKNSGIYMRQRDNTQFYAYLLKLQRERSYYIKGIFANCKYFADIKEQLLCDFTFPKIKDTVNLKWAEKIKNTESCSIHLRRGDYVSEGIILLEEDYYNTAMKIVEERCKKKCIFFVFTDDVQCAKKYFEKKEDVFYIEGNDGDNSYIDMQLMSLCKHNIIANSSFSFWGAYLNKNKNKIVVSSKQPYNLCKCPFTCKEWIKI